MELRLEGKRALVTGASRGIGRAIALALAAEGARVVAGYRRPGPEAAAVERELKEHHGHAVQADLAEPGGPRRLAEQCGSLLGGLDILVNNAGAMSQQPYDELPPDEWERLIGTNLTAVHLLVQAALPLLADGSSIVNIGSGLALAGMPGRAPYTASKAGLIGLSRSLAKELGPRRIRVNLIAPGIVETDLTADLPPAARQRYESLSASGRLGQVSDIASVAVFLASTASSYVNGVSLPVDGGI